MINNKYSLGLSVSQVFGSYLYLKNKFTLYQKFRFKLIYFV